MTRDEESTQRNGEKWPRFSPLCSHFPFPGWSVKTDENISMEQRTEQCKPCAQGKRNGAGLVFQNVDVSTITNLAFSPSLEHEGLDLFRKHDSQHIKILTERTSLFKSGARCLTPPPVPPPQTNLKSPVFEDWNGLVTFSSFHCWVFHCKVLYTRNEETAKYECQAGGFNMRLDKDPEDDHSQRFELRCLGGDPPTWDQPDWPTCASSEF